MRAHFQLLVRRPLVVLFAAVSAIASAAACATSGTTPGATAGEAAANTTARDCATTRGLRLSIGGGAMPGGEGRLTPGGTVIGAAQGNPGASRARDPRVALAEICQMMARSAAAWNRGDLDAFVADYLPGAGTTYIGRRGIMRGPAAIRDAYAPRFAPGAPRDSLSFEDVEVDVLGPDVVNTIAWYVLSRGDSVVARGPTSLVMRRVQGQWKIVHDHSS